RRAAREVEVRGGSADGPGGSAAGGAAGGVRGSTCERGGADRADGERRERNDQALSCRGRRDASTTDTLRGAGSACASRQRQRRTAREAGERVRLLPHGAAAERPRVGAAPSRGRSA